MSDETVVVRSDEVRVRSHHLGLGHRGLLALVDVFGKPYVVFHTEGPDGWAVARHRVHVLGEAAHRTLRVDVADDPHWIAFADDDAAHTWHGLLERAPEPAGA